MKHGVREEEEEQVLREHKQQTEGEEEEEEEVHIELLHIMYLILEVLGQILR